MAITWKIKQLLSARVRRPGVGFHALDYWETRHRDQRGSHRAVTNGRLSEQDNAQQYEVKRCRIADAVRRYFPDPTGRTLLDAGCGIGLLTSAYVDLGFTVTAVDFSSTAISEARRRSPTARFRVSPLSEIALGRRFDVIAVIDVFLHVVSDAEWRRTLAALARHLADGGVIIIIDWIDGYETRAAPHCVTRSSALYESALSDAGLRIDHVERFELVHERATKHLLAVRHAAAR